MLVLLITICILSGAYAAQLERVHDEELLNLIKVEKYVIVLFSKFVSFLFFSSLCFSLAVVPERLFGEGKGKILLGKMPIIYYLHFIYVLLSDYWYSYVANWSWHNLVEKFVISTSVSDPENVRYGQSLVKVHDFASIIFFFSNIM